MSRYIDADELIEFFDGYPDHIEFDVEDIKTIINEQDTADIRKNIKAQKVLAGGILDGTTHWYECSCCHGAVDILDAYCKHCGAVLELENDL